jgi:hypothetical protein
MAGRLRLVSRDGGSTSARQRVQGPFHEDPTPETPAFKTRSRLPRTSASREEHARSIHDLRGGASYGVSAVGCLWSPSFAGHAPGLRSTAHEQGSALSSGPAECRGDRRCHARRGRPDRRRSASWLDRCPVAGWAADQRGPQLDRKRSRPDAGAILVRRGKGGKRRISANVLYRSRNISRTPWCPRYTVASSPPEHHLKHVVPLHLRVESLQQRVDVPAVDRVAAARRAVSS